MSEPTETLLEPINQDSVSSPQVNEHETTKPMENIGFTGPVSKRKCQNLIFLIFFIIFWIGNGFLTWQAIITGNPNKLSFQRYIF